MTHYNTNLASEYYVLATLYRLGFDAYITLGNKKSIDIILNLNDEKQIYIVPYDKAKELMYHNPKGTRKGINLSTLRNAGKEYLNNWDLLRK